MDAVVLVPPSSSHKDWQSELEDVADKLNVDIKVSAYKGK
jgi:glycine cleavage system regulatory protein